MGYNPAVPREGETYGHLGPSPIPSPMYPMSPHYPHYPPSQVPPLALNSPPLHTSPPPSAPPSAGSSVVRQKQPDSGPSGSQSTTDRQPVRRPYHPNPPAQRSEWVMWAGNVPSDATHDELWQFLNQTPSPGSNSGPGASASDDVSGGVLSIFLISRSNCAFVNFQSEAHLHAAIQHFNGKQLRPADPRCPRLVCRVRGRDDDLKAGVGGQRGSGVHVRWIKDQKARAREALGQRQLSTSSSTTTSSSSPGGPVPMLASLSISSDDEGEARGARIRRPEQHSSSSGSFASTNSSILTQYFPKRYFILKSLSQDDLDLSVREGLWATQRHNEGTLDQAFRNSKDVYLIFGVNKSGEFFGYAKMASPIMHGEHSRVSWSSRTDSPPQRRSSRQSQSSKQGDSPTSMRKDSVFFPPSEQRYDESPLQVSPAPGQQLEDATTPRTNTDSHGRQYLSAPAELHQPHNPLCLPSAQDRYQQTSLDTSKGPRRQTGGFDLDPTAPLRAMRDHSAPPDPESRTEALAEDTARLRGSGQVLEPLHEEDERPEKAEATTEGHTQAEGPVWGESFRVEWLRTERLPFFRTRHLRNPWNHDREVKVSRDGTELEPSVGQALLDEWEKPDPLPPAPATDRRAARVVPAEGEGEGEGG
ncbi:YT521-B-like domain-containing protein [Amylocystis lapponica]|nr:YT521-B-like domain-containing protein [Amylocystis lapponica]